MANGAIWSKAIDIESNGGKLCLNNNNWTATRPSPRYCTAERNIFHPELIMIEVNGSPLPPPKDCSTSNTEVARDDNF